MAISTTASHVEAALRLYDLMNTAYMAIGKTSAWNNESNPPAEDKNAARLTEVIGYKKLKQYSLARPLAAGESESTVNLPVVTYGSKKWVLVPRAQAHSQAAHWLYMEAEIEPTDFPYGMYRQVGVHTGVVAVPGVTKSNLRPTEVSSTGTLQFYENRQPQNRTASVYAKEQFMIQV